MTLEERIPADQAANLGPSTLDFGTVQTHGFAQSVFA